MREEKEESQPREDAAASTLGADNLMPWEAPGGPGSGGGDGQAAKSIFDLFGPDDSEVSDDEKPVDDELSPDDQEAGDDPDDVEEDDEEGAEDDDEEEAEEDEEEGEQEAVEVDEGMVFAVKIDGQDEKVTLREALDGYQRQSTFTRKTQEIATERKALADDLKLTGEVREALGQQYALLEHALSEDSNPPDWEKLREEDPNRFANEYAAYQLRQEKLNKVKAAQGQLFEDQRADNEKVLQAHLVEERNKLSEVIPEFKDEVKAKAGFEEIRAYVASCGANDAEMAQIVDHRFVIMAQKAMFWDRLQTKGKEKLAEKKKTAKVLKPGARPTTPKGEKGSKRRGKAKAYARASEQLAQSGRVEDARDALLALEDE